MPNARAAAEQKVMQVLRAHDGEFPGLSRREIAEESGVLLSVVQSIITQMHEGGVIDYRPGVARSIRIKPNVA